MTTFFNKNAVFFAMLKKVCIFAIEIKCNQNKTIEAVLSV